MTTSLPVCLQRESLPNGWRPGDAIDLLPALRLQYPGWVCDTMLALELRAEEGDRTWHLRSRQIDEGTGRVEIRRLPLAPITACERGGHAFEHVNWSYFPDEIIARLFEIRRCGALAREVPLFKPAAMQSIKEFEAASAPGFDAVLADLQHQARRAEFCEDTARGLARLLADELVDRCATLVMRYLKGLDGSPENLWREAAEIFQDDDNELRDSVVNDIERRATGALKTLTNIEQRALWLCLESTGDKNSLRDLTEEWDAQQLKAFDPITTWSEGMQGSVSAIAGQVLRALNDVELNSDA